MYDSAYLTQPIDVYLQKDTDRKKGTAIKFYAITGTRKHAPMICDPYYRARHVMRPRARS
jgi:hypothetical protein